MGYVFKTDAIALASPNGRMSKRALKAAQQRIHDQLFPPGYWDRPQPTTEQKDNATRRAAQNLLDLAERGFRPAYHRKHAARLLASIAGATP